MKLAGEQLVLDTNILVHLLRGKDAGQAIEHRYKVGQRTPRAIISVVTKGELKALAYKVEWGPDKRQRLGAMLAGLPAADISHASIHEAYAAIDFAGLTLGVKMGKNDIWISVGRSGASDTPPRLELHRRSASRGVAAGCSGHRIRR